MKKSLPFFVLITCIFAFASCENREKEPLSSIAPSTSQAGTIPSVGNYFPLTIGTKWGYENVQNGAVDTTLLVRDSVFAGRSYKFFKTRISDYFVREENGVYYLRELNNLAIPDNSGTNERTLLRTDYGVGKAWNDDLSLVTGGRLRYENILIKIERERYVKGIKYENVLNVRTRIFMQAGASSSETLAQTTYNFYCKNKGLIETIGDTSTSKRLVYIGF
jgi:hypothetical protein